MKTALITTTINVPTVLELYRQHGPDVKFFVALDENSDFNGIAKATQIPNCSWLTPDFQKKWKCSPLIGFRNIQRRNLALLEAVAWEADIIVSIDDDNIPLDRWTSSSPSYFYQFQKVLNSDPIGFNGIKVSGDKGWFDVGALLDPSASHRGFPVIRRADSYRVEGCTNVRVGVAAGICLGDPDISATTRIERYPTVHRVSQLLESGIVVDPSTKTVFNSQNTAFIRELAPAFFMLPGVGRHDDIYASLIMQRVMKERNLHVHFGKPFVWQQRNQHNLVKDLRQEIDGMEFVEDFATCLDAIDLGAIPCREGDPPPAVLDQVSHIWRAIRREEILPPQTVEAALAFLDDLESIL